MFDVCVKDFYSKFEIPIRTKSVSARKNQVCCHNSEHVYLLRVNISVANLVGDEFDNCFSWEIGIKNVSAACCCATLSLLSLLSLSSPCVLSPLTPRVRGGFYSVSAGVARGSGHPDMSNKSFHRW